MSRYKGKFVTTLTEADVGLVIVARTIRLTEHLENGEDRPCEVQRKLWLHGSLGRVQTRDVGKQVWESDGILMVENDDQRDRRVAQVARDG